MKYSEVKKQLGLEVTKGEQDGLAYLTHYLQSAPNGVSHYFKKHALKFLSNGSSEAKQFAGFDAHLPIKWDVSFPPPTTPKFKFIDLFAGIGGMRMAFQNLGGKCVFTSEWNSYAAKTYEANFGEVPFGDITKIATKDIPEHDLLVGGFPCQPFSIAGVSKKNSLGKAHGFADETQGTLFFDVARIIKARRPKAFLLENVKNLLSHDKGRTFKVISKTLHDLNYDVHFKILDGQHYVPQHRERIFIVGFDKKVYKGQEAFKFPEMPDNDFAMEDILESAPESKYTLTDNLWSYLQKYAQKHKEKGNGFGFGMTALHGVARTLSARYYKDGSEILIPQGSWNPRRLTPRECARLQGYPDSFIIPVSDTQAYKQFGNSVVVPLIQAVGKNIVKAMLSANASNPGKKTVQ